MKKRTIGLLTLFVVGILFSAVLVSAYRGDPSVQGPNFDEERHEAMQVAFADVNYDEWYTLMTQDGASPKVTEVVTEENFEIFVAAHNAALAGDMQTANQLRAEIGLNNGVGPRDGSGYKRGSQGQMQGKHMNNFVDSDGDGNCDNLGTGKQGQMKGQGKSMRGQGLHRIA